ncbi:MAG TPA: hypothetical protein VJ570_13665 [Holophagaceae bacterium]|nr:hypothetical protein [Holophagaceae bacterium]
MAISILAAAPCLWAQERRELTFDRAHPSAFLDVEEPITEDKVVGSHVRRWEEEGPIKWEIRKEPGVDILGRPAMVDVKVGHPTTVERSEVVNEYEKVVVGRRVLRHRIEFGAFPEGISKVRMTAILGKTLELRMEELKAEWTVSRRWALRWERTKVRTLSVEDSTIVQSLNRLTFVPRQAYCEIFCGRAVAMKGEDVQLSADHRTLTFPKAYLEAKGSWTAHFEVKQKGFFGGVKVLESGYIRGLSTNTLNLERLVPGFDPGKKHEIDFFLSFDPEVVKGEATYFFGSGLDDGNSHSRLFRGLGSQPR